MRIFRSILSLILILTATLLVSCGSPTASAPPTYTPEKLAQIKTFRIPVDTARERMIKLSEYINQEDWVDTESFIHGPLGLMRRDMRYLAEALLPEDKEQAKDLAKEVFGHLEKLDAAAQEKNYSVASKQFNEAIKDFDDYLKLIPQPEATEAKA